MKIRNDFLPLYRPAIDSEEIKNVIDTLKSGWLTTGPKVKRFEDNVCEYLGCKKAVGLTSCTGGLHISLAALGIGPGDEVILPAYTFVASAHVIEWLGAKPVFVDVEKDTFNIDPKKIEGSITDRTKAIMAVHFAGHSCDMDAILKIAEKYDLKVVEDAAHAIGTRYKGKMIGTLGDTTVFSFYATKSITTGEGGMVVTNDKDLGDNIKKISYFGVDKDAFNRYSDKGTWYYEIISLGYKYNMDELQGSLGVEQLKKLNKFISKKIELAKYYDELFLDIPEIITPKAKGYTFHSYHLYPILLDINKVSIDRDELIRRLREYKVGASVHFIPLHLHPYYQKKYNLKRGDFPISEYLYDRELSLPLFPTMKKEDVEYVVSAIKEIIRNGRF